MSIKASPSVRKYAADNGVDLDALAKSTGRETLGREDIDQQIGGAISPGPDHRQYWEVDHAAFGPVATEELPRIAQVALRNLAAANATIPQVTHHDRADTTAVEAFRKRLKPRAMARGAKLTALAFHVKTLGRCLLKHPKFNASLSGDERTVIYKKYVHIGIAVDTPHGLMVPVVRDVDQKGLWQIAGEIADLAARAKARKIKPDEMGGASMSISNLGGIGGTAFTPLVNPPEVAILGITRTETIPSWDGQSWRPVPMVPLDLSYDHRLINGADAARFLADYCRLFDDPRRLLRDQLGGCAVV